MRIHPVILCGGAGARLWPASREGRPKPFLPLLGARSLFQDTVLRMTGLAGGQAPVIVAGTAQADLVLGQLAEIGIAADVLIEPEGRDSAPAVAAATAWIARRDPQGLVAMVASDHHIPDAAAFRSAVETAAPVAERGAIVTFGVEPAEPSTAYGYIAPGEALAGSEVRAVARFVEKPDPEAARAYVEAGYLWNSGNFVFAAAVLMEELALLAPEVARAAAAAVDGADTGGPAIRLGDAFRSAPKISIDYAVMEKTARAAVLPVSFAWSDVGAWAAVHAAASLDGDGNAVEGDALLVGSRDSLVRNPDGPLVVGVGLRRIGVVVEKDAILVCDLDASQGVKTAVDRLKAMGRAEAAPPIAIEPRIALAGLQQRFRRWLMASALPLWWSLGADHDLGGFREALDGDAVPVVASRRTRVQARQAYVYALAGSLGWSGPWAQAAAHGIDFLRARYRKPDGLYLTLLNPDGSPADHRVMIYDQAFVLLALAHGSKALPQRAAELRAEAEAIREALKRFSYEGGFVESVPRTLQADPQMHMLEAALAWEEIAGGAWTALADSLARLGMERLIDPSCGALKEVFDVEWAIATDPEGRRIEPGHQFEWAWLLERWGRLRNDPEARSVARRLFAVGERGVNAAGVTVSNIDEAFKVSEATARLWPQTERLKAAMILAEGETDGAARTRYQRSALQAGEALMGYFEGTVPGLWRDKRLPDGSFVEEPAPASSFYHIICAFAELSARS